jgi:hypothetical protein
MNREMERENFILVLSYHECTMKGTSGAPLSLASDKLTSQVKRLKCSIFLDYAAPVSKRGA